MLDGLTLNEHSQIELSKCKIFLKNKNEFLIFGNFLNKNFKNLL
jgi:hypothetical protein